jgi:uncharacterized protein (DUF302 family)
MTSNQNLMEISGTETVWQIVHRQLRACVDFDQFTTHLEQCLGKFDPSVMSVMVQSPGEARARIETMQGAQDLMIFLALDHGRALTMVHQQAKAVQYLIGNPLTAIQMTRHELAAALYAPLRVLVYESANGDCIVEYDQPSSLFGQFENPEVHRVGMSLDRKLAAVLQRAAELANQ